MGQAYGGVSAVLSALAFCGIAGSLLLQWRQTRISQIVVARERHFELVKLALDRPEFIFAQMGIENPADWPLALYFNLWITHWKMLRELGLMGEEGLRQNARELFGNTVALEWWAKVGPNWATGGTKGDKLFARIVTEENERVSAAAGAEVGSVEARLGGGEETQ
jgi:hypothetical protein